LNEYQDNRKHELTTYFGVIFLADRTNGRAYGTMWSVCRLYRFVLWLNGTS